VNAAAARGCWIGGGADRRLPGRRRAYFLHFFFPFPVVGSLGDTGHFFVVLFVPLIVPLATISRSDSDTLSFVNNVGKPAIVPFAGPKEMLSTLALRASGAELAAAGNGSITMKGKIPDVMTRVLLFMMEIP
jgi:hypothetical protein